ncbi:translocation/assembly module TamB domain-containing protein [Ferruginibacter lapsinanis]|uniref:translocation/assembly module TamB domain-containing protein n=1 Tax=Ferruginibacter lapsinanis TaxID=563172 RepID=UPI001E2A5DE2|nr:translocation/assembly module TamB domain-containing protein [Ferruginibacter lapsinanis]UEG48615.1 translocation/assembly module TamB domain-containing protein [Ferruginibacter lapsinanis]
MALILLLVLLYIAIHLAPVQTWIVKKVANAFSEKLKTRVSVKHVDFAFFNKMEIRGVLVEDRQRDTLLYAGTAIVNITDWFFIKDKSTLRYVGLDDAVVNMKRTDSVWNYQFLIDYFSGPKKIDTTTKKGGIEFDVKILQLQNIRFNQIDKWVGQDMTINMKKLSMFADDIDFTKKIVNLNTLDITEPLFSQNDYTGNRDKLHIPRPPKKISDKKPDAYQWNNDGWIANIKNIHITNGVFNNEKENSLTALLDNRFYGEHIIFKNITGDLKNVHFEKDTLTTDISLSSKERSGFEVKKLEAAVKFTPQMMEFNKLNLVTNKSRLGNYYAMRYKEFSDMNSFLHRVTLEGNFENSILSSDDLAYFAPELRSWKRIFTLKGNANGTIDNFTAKKMIIKSGNTSIDGDIALSGLPDIDNTFIDFTSRDLITNYTDLTSIIPSLKSITQPQLSKLGNIRYKGNFTGFLSDFVAYGTINTDLGVVTGDLNLKLPEKKPIVYSGKIATTGFQLGKFINNNDFNNIAFDGKVNGVGISTNNVKANLDGSIQRIDFGGYTYQNINVKGDFGKRIFNGTASIDDPNLKLENLQGKIDLSGKIPQINFDVYLAKANLQKLHFTKDSFDVTGHFNLNFTGSNIDNFLGKASIYNATLHHNNQPLSFDSLVLKSEIIDNKKQLTVQSNEADVKINGDFTILELPKAFQLFLNNYYPAYIEKPKAVLNNQDFTFSIHTKNVDDYIGLLDKKLHGFNNSTVDGVLRLKENKLTVNADIPEFSYDGKTFNDLRLQSVGNLDTLVTEINVADIMLGDSLHLPTTNLHIRSQDDISDIGIKTSASKTLSNAELHAQVQTMTDGVKINFSPSTFILNDKQWQIEKDGELTLRNSQISAHDLKFIQGNQQVDISTELSEDGGTNDIKVGLTSINIDDFLPFFIKDPHMEGQVSGKVLITNPFGKPSVDYDIKADNFKFEKDSIGLITANGRYSSSGIVTFKVNAANDSAYKFNVDGSFDTRDTITNQANILFKSDRFNLAILNNYLDGIFSDIHGYANTNDLKISGNSKHLNLTGTATITDASMIVNYTQCKYKFSNETVIFNPNEIDFGMIDLKDTLNNTATLSGKMYHHFFRDFEFDDVRFDTKKLLVLNTLKKDNSQFYGKVIGRATMTLNGSADNMIMNIDGEPSRTDSSHIYLLSGSSVENGAIDYINFIQFGKEMENNLKLKASSSILVNMTLKANPACKIDVILDEATGDIIKGVGVSNELKITVGNKEPLSIRGRYDITKGEYTFNYQSIIKKPFTLNGGTINWSGDPYLANIDMAAEYLSKNVDFSGISDNNTKRKNDVIVVALLKGTLLKPKINFEFQLPDNSPLRNDILITKRLQEFTNDENEMNKQVTSLLLFNSFLNSNQQFLTASSGLNVATNTIGGMVSGVLANSLNKLLQTLNLNNNVAFNFDLNSSIDLQSNIAKLQGAAKLGITLTFFENRLIINVGGNFDYNNPYAAPSNKNKITPDLTVEWLLNEDGRVRLIGFNQTNTDIIGQRNRTGIKLTYRKDVNKLSNLFKKSNGSSGNN